MIEQLQARPLNDWTAAPMDQWQAWELILSAVLANGRPKNKLHEKGTDTLTDTLTDGHRDSMKESAKGRFFGKKPLSNIIW